MPIRKSQGSIFQVAISDDVLESVYRNITCVVSWDGFDGEVSDVDRTCLESQAAENDPGIPDFGQMSLQGFDDDEDNGRLHLQEMRENLETRNFRHVYRGATGSPPQPRIDFRGYVKSIGFSGGVHDNNRAPVIIRVTGFPRRFPLVTAV